MIFLYQNDFIQHHSTDFDHTQEMALHEACRLKRPPPKSNMPLLCRICKSQQAPKPTCLRPSPLMPTVIAYTAHLYRAVTPLLIFCRTHAALRVVKSTCRHSVLCPRMAGSIHPSHTTLCVQKYILILSTTPQQNRPIKARLRQPGPYRQRSVFFYNKTKIAPCISI